MSSIPQSWRVIENVLSECAPSTRHALRKPANEKELKRLERALPAELPRDFIESCRIHDGMNNSHLGPNRFFNYWALLPLQSIVEVWDCMTQLQADEGFGSCQFDVSPRIKNDAHWRAGWLPFMDADGDKVLLDLDPGVTGTIGQVVKWSNSGSFPTKVLADSFDQWLAHLADKLSKRQFEIEYGGVWFSTD